MVLGTLTQTVKQFEKERMMVYMDAMGVVRPKLLITIGLPKSGKSTYLDKHAYGSSILCPDDFRWAIYGHEFFKEGEPFVWAAVEAAARAMLRRNQYVVIDATNTTVAARRTWVRLAREFDIPLDALIFRAPFDLCEMRAAEEGAHHMKAVIRRMYAQWETILDYEQINVIQEIP